MSKVIKVLILLAAVVALSAAAVVFHPVLIVRQEVQAESHLTPAPEKTEKVVSGPDEPIRIESPDRVTMFGDGSWYDYDFNPDGTSRLCYIDREDCYTGTHYVAAMRDAPRGTMVKVTNLDNGRSVTVKITDFSPDESVFPDRIIDLSSAAFGEIAYLPEGIIMVKLEWEK